MVAVSVLCVLVHSALACTIYDRAYGGSAVGRVEDGKIYNRAYGGTAIGRGEGCGQMSLGAGAFLLLF
mgnify:CR=1 FL=1